MAFDGVTTSFSRLQARQRQTSPLTDHVEESVVHWVTTELVAQVGFRELTHEDRLRHPRFLGLRSDKQPGEIVRERPDP